MVIKLRSMTGCKVRLAPVLLSLATYSFAQGIPSQTKPPDSAPESVSLSEMSSVQVPSLPAESIGAPLLCDPRGRIVFRLATPDGMEDPVSVSSDGKEVVHFAAEKINDISRPVMLSIFLAGSDVYVLTKGSTPLGYEQKLRTPNGAVIEQEAAKSGMFVAHFEAGGSYNGAVRLDLPFRATRLGVFENGDFLISGPDPATDEPRVAIVAPNGQLRRFLDLAGDVHAQNESSSSGKDSDPTALPRSSPAAGRPAQSFVTETLRGVVSTSQIAKDGRDLLLFRPMSGPVFSVSPSGEVRVHRLKIEGNYRLYTIKSAGGSWIAEFLHDVPNSAAVELSTYAFDPESGASLRKYYLPPDAGWGLACADGNEFTFIVADEKANALKIVKLTPGAN
jgi:hypothetical protein